MATLAGTLARLDSDDEAPAHWKADVSPQPAHDVTAVLDGLLEEG